jgi:hypothetical protein
LDIKTSKGLSPRKKRDAEFEKERGRLRALLKKIAWAFSKATLEKGENCAP